MEVQIPTCEGAILTAKMGPAQNIPGHVGRSVVYGADADSW